MVTEGRAARMRGVWELRAWLCDLRQGPALSGPPYPGLYDEGWSKSSPRVLLLGLHVSLPKGKSRGNKKTRVVSLVLSPSQIQTKMSSATQIEYKQ